LVGTYPDLAEIHPLLVGIRFPFIETLSYQNPIPKNVAFTPREKRKRHKKTPTNVGAFLSQEIHQAWLDDF
jgi:hypothetical protein